MNQAAARIYIPKENVSEAIPQLFAVVRHMDDRRHVLSRQVDGVRETRDEYNDCVWIRRVDLLNQFFLFQREAKERYGVTN
jgi:hypothetical protein